MTTYSSNIQETIDTIRNFDIRREVQDGLAYISELDEDVANDPDVKLVCTSFYVTWHYYEKAEQRIDRASFEGSEDPKLALLQEAVAGEALLSATVDFLHHRRYQKALATARLVEEVYIKENAGRPQHAGQEQRLNYIQRQTALWEKEDPEWYDDLETPISDTRVWLEARILEIYMLAVENGFMEWTPVQSQLRARILPLLKFLRNRGRRLPEAWCMFLTDMHNLLPNRTEAAAYLQGYIESLSGYDVQIFKACALSRIAQYQVGHAPDVARQNLDEGLAIFNTQNVVAHIVGDNFIRIRDFQKKTHTPANRFEQLCLLASKAQSLDDLTYQFLVYRAALAIASDVLEMWPQLQRLTKELEHHLSRKGDTHRLCILRVIYHLSSTYHLQYSEHSRRLLNNYLTQPTDDLTPDLFAAICKGLYECYDVLGQYELAVKFASDEYNSEMARMSLFRKSEALERLANARIKVVDAELKYRLKSGAQGTEDERTQELINELHEIATLLEDWIEIDRRHSWTMALTEKAAHMQMIYYLLRLTSPSEEYVVKYNYWLRVQTEDATGTDQASRIVKSLVGGVLSYVHKKQYEEGLAFAQKILSENNMNTSMTAFQMATIRFTVVCAIQGVLASAKPTEASRRKFREQQLNWLFEDINALKLYRSGESLLQRCSLLCLVVFDCIEIFPERRATYLSIMLDYFRSIERIVDELRRSLRYDVGIEQLLRKQKVVSKFNLLTLYQYAPQFFFRVGDEVNAWAWVQKGRGRALLDMLSDQSSNTPRMLSVLENDPSVSDMLSQEDALVADLNNANAEDYISALQALTEHQATMTQIPALAHLLERQDDTGSIEYNELDQVWTTARWLPPGRNVIIVNWFIDPNGIVYRITMNYNGRDLTPRWWRLKITLKAITKWVSTYLHFPMDMEKPLESHLKAPRKLWQLVDGLEVVCAPGDLVILTPPAQFSSIPLHAIPLDGIVIADRNPIIYCSSLRLYQTCLTRASKASNPISRSLTQAIFTATYEEAGYEAERRKILVEVQQLADLFGSRTILGTELTSETLRRALFSAPWIHFHGHAYYVRSQAINQCFVLSSGEKLQQIVDIERLEDRVSEVSDLPSSTLPYELDDIERKAILSSHLLQDSSQLTVADLFTMNFSQNHPFVFCMACDSGVQDFADGDEPLGLLSALFCAGAASVLGTLWPVQSVTARDFSRFFYGNILHQVKNNEIKATSSGVKVLDLSLAVQEATMKIKKQQPDPYSWAAFVLHGSGLYFYE